MENTESGDELGTSFLHGDHQAFLVHDDMDEDLELAEDNNTDDSSHDVETRHVLREQDRFLPIANVAKIMKKAIPESGKIAKDARECVQECVSEFISFITSEASERCQTEKRKTINGEDILFAMTTLGFDNYVEPLKLYLLKYREATKGVPRTIGASELFDDVPEEVFIKQLVAKSRVSSAKWYHVNRLLLQTMGEDGETNIINTDQAQDEIILFI